jgi:DNA-damage-inducible protein D
MSSLQPAQEVSAFEQIRHRDGDGHEYWLARELMRLLGYRKWQNFERVLAEAMSICELEGPDALAINFTAISKNKSAAGLDPRGRRGEDYQLTRHACYIVAESADGRKDEVAWAKIYFALTTERYELLAQSEEERVRIEQRQQIALHNAELALRARQAGAITGRQFAKFFNDGYRGMYDGETAEAIRQRKQLPPRAEILDWMGGLESAANAMRGTLALHHIDAQQDPTLSQSSAIHYRAGVDVRGFLISQGVYPEKLPTPAKSYQQLLREQATRERLAAEDRTGLWALLDAAADEAAGEPDA